MLDLARIRSQEEEEGNLATACGIMQKSINWDKSQSCGAIICVVLPKREI